MRETYETLCGDSARRDRVTAVSGDSERRREHERSATDNKQLTAARRRYDVTAHYDVLASLIEPLTFKMISLLICLSNNKLEC